MDSVFFVACNAIILFNFSLAHVPVVCTGPYAISYVFVDFILKNYWICWDNINSYFILLNFIVHYFGPISNPYFYTSAICLLNGTGLNHWSVFGPRDMNANLFVLQNLGIHNFGAACPWLSLNHYSSFRLAMHFAILQKKIPSCFY